ncbi:hypothetical protein JR316_0001721 [Psilocybe cubensis]|uniref:Uncharacterized protein n=1 Tax=Psilocybe cubensis TaxID=181762 RepID=A0ACB8HC93_PSICU|nr:hypothetical protein JR316_0001721 [Psilocybe cubensis]KAH9484819.1 hypothetical protein JR316_0001721 [Psilocybe cubensis]
MSYTTRTPRKCTNDENKTPLRRPASTIVFRQPKLTPSQTTPSREPLTPFKSNSTPISFVDGLTPQTKKRKAQSDIQEQKERRRKEKEVKVLSQQQQENEDIDHYLGLLNDGGYTLHSFMSALLRTTHPVRSSQVSRMLVNHGKSLLDNIMARERVVATDWALSTTRQLAAMEADALAAEFTPSRGQSMFETLAHFSLSGFLQDAERIAPTLYNHFRVVAFPPSSEKYKHKQHDLILATVFCMLAKSRSEHATDFQTSMCLYLLACGTSKSLFNVLNHAGLTLSYSQAVEKLKKLSDELLEETRTIAHLVTFMIIWDNINFAFRVSQQRHDAKDHFDNGTTATLVPLFGVEVGSLPTSLKPPRVVRPQVLEFDGLDLLPSCEEAFRVQNGQLWHIEDILYNAFPDLRSKLFAHILPAPTVHQIPVHQTRQYPLPAMHIDESSLDGTLNVLSTILQTTLQMSEEDVKRHGIIICAGDQLSLSLLDKASAIRRDDTNFLDNIGRFTEGQEGLLHLKFSHARMIANEFWGKPNARSPWSLWKVNTLLARKPISAGWKVKSPAPFRPVYELILDLTLPANILDAFRIHCGYESLETWIKTGVTSVDDVRRVSQLVLDKNCSGRRVQSLRATKMRDIPLENIILFNRDALYLRQLKYAIKKGDVGVVLDLCTHLMLAFRGTGKTPKYADALFGIVMRLKKMNSTLRDAWLNNWLANLSGKVDGFKEMDLLQEHQNFWLKIIYSAKGSNRSWQWLSMVSVCIFALRDVMRRMHKEYSTPFNSISHTTPTTATDIATLRTHLEAQSLQTYTPKRENNDDCVEARDLLQAGSEYANKPSAYHNFKYAKIKTTHRGTKSSNLSEESVYENANDKV